MKPTLLLFAFSALSTLLAGQTDPMFAKHTKEVFSVQSKNSMIKEGPYKFYYGDKLQASGQYTNGKKTGVWVYTPIPKIKITGCYENDSMTGTWVYLRKKDTLAVINYTNGDFDGPQKGFFDKGGIASEVSYKHGKKDGTEKIFYKNGWLKQESHYLNGELHGDQTWFSEKGEITGKLSFYKGTPINMESIDKNNSNDYYTGTLKNGTGMLNFYQWLPITNGTLRLSRNYQDSLLHGAITGFNTYGDTAFTGQYEKGIMVGRWKFYNDKGKFDHDKTYKYAMGIEKDKDEFLTNGTYGLNEALVTMTEFPGGDAKRLNYIREIAVYPTDCRIANIQGEVKIGFTVNRVGKVVDVKVIESVNPSLDSEAVRVIRLQPYWVPGFSDGIPVKIQFRQPFPFRL